MDDKVDVKAESHLLFQSSFMKNVIFILNKFKEQKFIPYKKMTQSFEALFHQNAFICLVADDHLDCLFPEYMSMSSLHAKLLLIPNLILMTCGFNYSKPNARRGHYETDFLSLLFSLSFSQNNCNNAFLNTILVVVKSVKCQCDLKPVTNTFANSDMFLELTVA